MSVFLDACRGEPTPYTPIWLNRQAGRYMPEYRQVKGDTPSLEFFKNPELAAKVTIDAQRILDVDAAIMFADLLPMLEPMGFELDYLPGIGPVFANPICDARDVERVRVVHADEGVGYIRQTVANIRQDLPKRVALIGFAGAPFTLASYVIEGKSSRDFAKTKKLMFGNLSAWNELMEKLTSAVGDYVELQMDAGVDAVQIFDSWVGTLSSADYEYYVASHVKRLMSRIGGRVPIIYFAVGNSHLLHTMQSTGPDFMALDWRVALNEAWDDLGTIAIQGNLDPLVLCADRATVQIKAEEILDSVAGRPGHIFNLGHGIVPQTPVDHVRYLVDFVHEHTS